MTSSSFLRDNCAFLGAGALLMFASSFGQTFFIALSGPALRAEFNLSHGGWGAINSAATLGSATLLIFAGALSDRFRARALAGWVMAAYAATCLGVAATGWWPLLIPLIFGLRFCGQGLMVQIATTALARWFHARRARALSLAALGLSLAVIALPALAGWVAANWGWRAVWLLAAALILITGLALRRLLRLERTPQALEAARSQPGMGGRSWRRSEAVGSHRFWLLALGVAIPPFLGTALFFQASALSVEKGWGVGAPALFLPVIAVTTIAANLGLSGLVDRVGARRLLPFFQLPTALGMMAPLAFDGLWAGMAIFALQGVTDGLAISLLGAIWPELFGTRHVGAIRGLAMSCIVFGTAIAPGATGALIDLGIGLPTQFAAMGVLALAVCAIFAALTPRLK